MLCSAFISTFCCQGLGGEILIRDSFEKAMDSDFQGYKCRCNERVLRLHQPTFNKHKTRLCSFFPLCDLLAEFPLSGLKVVPSENCSLFIYFKAGFHINWVFLPWWRLSTWGPWKPNLHFSVCQCSHFIVKDITTLILPPTVGPANCLNITWQLASNHSSQLKQTA